MVVITGNRESDIKSIASVLNEIGVGGLNIEVATDNEGYLKDLMAKGLTKSNTRSFYWRNISKYKSQTKGIERAVGIAKEGIYTNWLAFEEHCQCRIVLEPPLLGYLMWYVHRTFDVRVGLLWRRCMEHVEARSCLYILLVWLDLSNLFFWIPGKVIGWFWVSILAWGMSLKKGF